jgi:hypothetical protein
MQYASWSSRKRRAHNPFVLARGRQATWDLPAHPPAGRWISPVLRTGTPSTSRATTTRCSTPTRCVGLAICRLHMPEVIRALALYEAEIIFLPAPSTTDGSGHVAQPDLVAGDREAGGRDHDACGQSATKCTRSIRTQRNGLRRGSFSRQRGCPKTCRSERRGAESGELAVTGSEAERLTRLQHPDQGAQRGD